MSFLIKLIIGIFSFLPLIAMELIDKFALSQASHLAQYHSFFWGFILLTGISVYLFKYRFFIEPYHSIFYTCLCLCCSHYFAFSNFSFDEMKAFGFLFSEENAIKQYADLKQLFVFIGIMAVPFALKAFSTVLTKK